MSRFSSAMAVTPNGTSKNDALSTRSTRPTPGSPKMVATGQLATNTTTAKAHAKIKLIVKEVLMARSVSCSACTR
jgi:hypothetical protein